jgi:multidrug efflux pump subunit AcrA (membrane-fusion protein)
MNPRGFLVPGMVVAVVLRFAPRQALTVHADSVIDSGTTKSVFVARGAGEYEFRPVVTGSQEGDRVEILAGLKPGERVVNQGAFLLDAESRLKSPAAQFAAGSTP